MRRRLFCVLGVSAVLAGVGGCAHWTKPPEKGFQLPRPRLAVESTMLEVTFVRLPAHDVRLGPRLWADLDEQCFNVELRQKLAANGLRVGVVGMQLPATLRELLPQAEPPLAAGEAATFDESKPAQSVRQMQCHPGKRAEILASETNAQLTVLVHEEGLVRGETFAEAQCVFAVKTYPQGDGRVKLELLPEIDHGQPKQRFISQDGAFRMLAARDQKLFESLKMEFTLAPGQTVALGDTESPRGVGSHFFADAQEPGRRRLLLIRLAQPALDDLFLPAGKAAPLATPVD